MRIELLDMEYCIQEIKNSTKNIEKNKSKLEEFKGKPIYDTCLKAIEKDYENIQENLINLDYFYNKLKTPLI